MYYSLFYTIIPLSTEEIHRHGRHVNDTLKYKFCHYVRHVAGRISTDGIKRLAYGNSSF